MESRETRRKRLERDSQKEEVGREKREEEKRESGRGRDEGSERVLSEWREGVDCGKCARPNSDRAQVLE